MKHNSPFRLLQVFTVTLSTTLSHLTIGLGDSTVLLYRHLNQTLSSSNSLTALPKPCTVKQVPNLPSMKFKVSEEGNGS
jgi:hypothetical protein